MHIDVNLHSKASGPLLFAAMSAIGALAMTIQASAQQVVRLRNMTSVPRLVKIEYVPIEHIRIDSGKQMYEAYCASCHGVTGKGDGVYAPVLGPATSDLTQLAAQNGGKFPSIHVKNILTGKNTHVSRAGMPDWYPAFRSLNRSLPSLANLRALNLTNYVRKLQVAD